MTIFSCSNFNFDWDWDDDNETQLKELTVKLDSSSLTKEEKNRVYRQVLNILAQECIPTDLPEDYDDCKEFLYEIWTCEPWECSSRVHLDSFNTVDLDDIDSTIVALNCGHDGFNDDDIDLDIKDPKHPKHLAKFKRFTNLKRLFICAYYCPYTTKELLSVLPKGAQIYYNY